jgi:hypothetical protein
VTDSNPSYTCYTLFDIPDRGNRSQTRNWNTLIQIISLRTQPFITKFPAFEIDNLANYSFGKQYQGQAKIWSFEFEIEHPYLFEVDGDPLYNLKHDTNLVPVVDYGTFIQPPRCFLVSGDACNIYYVYNQH